MTFKLAFCLLVTVCNSAFLNSADLTKGPASVVEFFEVISAEDVLDYLAAPVYMGVATTDGGYVAVGSAISSEDGSSDNSDGFILKVDSDATYVWHHIIAETANKADRVLAVAEGPSDDDYALYACGVTYTSVDGYDRFLVKIDTSTGARVWLQAFADPTAGKTGAWEFLDLHLDTGHLVMSGFTDGPEDMSLGEFKSGGNPEDCYTNVASISLTALQGEVAPTSSDLTYDISDFGDLISGTAVRALSDGAVFISRNWNEEDQLIASVVRLDLNGNEVWSHTYEDQGEATDLAVAPDESYYIMSGLKNPGLCDGYDGSFTRLEASDGSQTWSQSHGNLNPLIYDECWGLQIVSDSFGTGVISSCGMGVEPEHCPEDSANWDEAAQLACADVAQGGFGPVWRTAHYRLDSTDGSLVWQTVDQYSFEDDGETLIFNSASEYIALTSDGGAIAFADCDTGVGFVKLSPLDSGAGDIPALVTNCTLEYTLYHSSATGNHLDLNLLICILFRLLWTSF